MKTFILTICLSTINPAKTISSQTKKISINKLKSHPNVGKDSKKLLTHGYNAHKYGIKLGMCKGDCDSDAHCKKGLKCYQSHRSGNIVTGCEGRTKLFHDYCYDPLHTYHSDVCDPRYCNDWDNFMWCKCFDANKEESYVVYGCADDGKPLIC